MHVLYLQTTNRMYNLVPVLPLQTAFPAMVSCLGPAESGVTADRQGISLRGDKNVLELDGGEACTSL